MNAERLESAFNWLTAALLAAVACGGQSPLIGPAILTVMAGRLLAAGGGIIHELGAGR